MNNNAVLLKGRHTYCNSSNCSRNQTPPNKPRPLKKIIASQTLIQHCNDGKKSCSTGIINHPEKKSHAKSRITTKSDLTFTMNVPKYFLKSDICKQCGDVKEKNESKQGKNQHIMYDKVPSTSTHHEDSPTLVSRYQIGIKSSNKLQNNKKKHQTLKQYYKNENFALSSESVHITQSKNKRKPSLCTIKEISEVPISEIKSSKDVLFEINHDSTDEEMGYFDSEDQENIKKINEFRDRNYFECHSANSRIKAKGSTTSLGDHKCVYRFYLNERLFPVPLSMDHRNNIRCIECQLPLEETRITSKHPEQFVNGTIQAKVKLNEQVQDMILMLPVKEPLIIKEKRKQLKSVVNHEELYFGIIKLDLNGDSIFNRIHPSDSLALKYQKGYKEFENNHDYKYDCVNNEDVIII